MTPQFRSDLYKGTARYYDSYRVPYPATLLDDLAIRAGLSGAGRLLDLACGLRSGHLRPIQAFRQRPRDRPRGRIGQLRQVPRRRARCRSHRMADRPSRGPQALAGFAHSTSILSRSALGDHVQAVERDLRDRLLAAEPNGHFEESVSFTYDLAVKS